jgi:hypothetical protein
VRSTARCTPTEPTALSCFSVDSSFVVSTDNATAAKGKVLDAMGGIFEDGKAIQNAIPDAVYYQVNSQDRTPTSSPVSNASPVPNTSPVFNASPVSGTSPVSNSKTNQSGFPLAVSILLSILGAVLVLVCAYFVYRKRQKALRQKKYAATQALLRKDYLQNSELFDENISPYGDVEDYQQQNDEGPETSSNTDHEDERNEPLGEMIDDRSGSGTRRTTTYEDEEAKKSSDDGNGNTDEEDPSDRAESEVDMLFDEKLRISDTGVATGFIDAETSHSVASDLTDMQPYNGVDTRYESVVTMAQIFDDAEALAEAEATAQDMSMLFDFTDVVIVRSLLLLPIVSILFGNAQDLFVFFRTTNDEVDLSGALVPYEGDGHGDASVQHAGSDRSSSAPDQADDEQPDTGAHDCIVWLADEDDEPDQPDSCSSTDRNGSSVDADAARVGLDFRRDDDIEFPAELDNSVRNDDPVLVQDHLSQNESEYPPSRHDELDNTSDPGYAASSVPDPNFATVNDITSVRSATSYDEPNANDTMSYHSNHGASSGHDCQSLTSYERNAELEPPFPVDREEVMSTNHDNRYGNRYDEDDLSIEEGHDPPYRYNDRSSDEPRIRYEHSDGDEEHSQQGSFYDDNENRSEINGNENSYRNAYYHDDDERATGSTTERIGGDYIDEENLTSPYGRDASDGHMYEDHSARGDQFYDDQSHNSGLDVSNQSGGDYHDRGGYDDDYSDANYSGGHSTRSGQP